MPKGIEIRKGTIRIWFHWEGKRCREQLNISPNPANTRYAERLRAEIITKIKLGVFRYTEYFPDSPRAGHAPASRIEFKEYAATYLHLRSDLAKSTLKSYQAALTGFWYPSIGKRPLVDIDFTEIATALAKRKWVSNKTRNNYLIIARQIFDAAFVDGIIQRSPMDRVRNAKVQRPEPDPLTIPEIDQVITAINERYDEQVTTYFEFAFFTGLRTSELIALEWGDVDFQRRQVRVHQAKVEGEIKNTKTSRIRHVDLNTRALAALIRQKEHTFLAGKQVFHNPVTGNPWADDYRQRISYWHPTLKSLGMRARDAYQTRHTYATLLLMAGTNPAYVAQQLGHTTMKMTLERYARWLPHADNGAEIAKFERHFIEKNAPKVSQKHKTGT